MIKKIIFLGAPGVGKGTLAKTLSKKENLEHISTGDIFRYNIKNNTLLGKEVKSILAAGNFVSDDLTNKIVKNTIINKEGYILDGYPRTINQAKFLLDLVDIDDVILLDATDQVVIERLTLRSEKEGRTDDTPEIISKRLEVYNKQTKPLIDFFKSKGILRKISVVGSREDNFKKLMDILK
ncbi:MAG: adenylate kinase [Mollicutes bacterium PWAP]|nr:adenylate kinase [Mollicutes bacterium PWAP]